MIPYYTQTMLELYSAEAYLRMLKDRRTLIYQKYFGYKSPSNFDIVPSQHNGVSKDNSVDYLAEINEKRYGERSLLEEIDFAEKDIAILKKCINTMQIQLSKSSNIEDKLYYQIVAKGLNVSKAMEKVADENYMSKKNVEKTYYPKIKEEIWKLKKIKKG